MTFNLLFLTVSVSKKKMSISEIEHQVRVNKIYEEIKDKQLALYRTF